MELVSWPGILTAEPFLIAGHAVHRVESPALEAPRHDGEAFERETRTKRMDLLEVGHETVEPPQLSLDPSNPKIRPVPSRVGRRGGVQHLPCLRDATGWVLSKEVMKQRAAGPGQPHDEERRADRCLRDAGMAFPVLDEAQTV